MFVTANTVFLSHNAYIKTTNSANKREIDSHTSITIQPAPSSSIAPNAIGENIKNINKDSGYFIGELFSDNECTPQNYDLATYFLRYSANSGNGDACFLLATFLAMQGNYNEKEVDTYFENAFKFGLNKLWFNGAYLKFVSYVDQRTQNKIKELESRYWNLVRDQA